jgi:hypothetical protein
MSKAMISMTIMSVFFQLVGCGKKKDDQKNEPQLETYKYEPERLEIAHQKLDEYYDLIAKIDEFRTFDLDRYRVITKENVKPLEFVKPQVQQTDVEFTTDVELAMFPYIDLANRGEIKSYYDLFLINAMLSAHIGDLLQKIKIKYTTVDLMRVWKSYTECGRTKDCMHKGRVQVAKLAYKS